MGQTGILLAVADPQLLAEVTGALGGAWDTTPVATEAEALAQLEQRSFDALLADFNFGSPDASELLNATLEKCPGTVRFLLAHEADLALVAAKVTGPHQLLAKPLEANTLTNRIESGLAKDEVNPNRTRPEAAADVPVAAIPSVYSEVVQALESPDVTEHGIGMIISRDAALTAEVLQFANSGAGESRRKITNPVKAVQALGLDVVKALVMARRFLAEHSRLNQGYVSFETLWHHSTNVAQIARDLMYFETKDRKLAAEAFVAGLVHDLGKVVLVSNFDDLYARVHSLARKQPVALWEIEKEMFGANHGEIGACLVGMWNLPNAVVQAVALHHEPPVGEFEQLNALAAVHIANVFEHEVRPNDECRVAPILDTTFLNEMGLLQRLPVWRAAFANRKIGAAATGSDTDEAGSSRLATGPSRTGNQLPATARKTRTGTVGQSETPAGMLAAAAAGFRERRWVYAGLGVAIVALMAFWSGTQSNLNEPDAIYARTPSVSEAPIVTAPTPVAQPTPGQMPETAPAASRWDTAPAPAAEPVAAAITNPAPLLPAPAPAQPAAPAPAVAAPVAVAPTPPPTVAPEVKPQPEFRLNGIIYTVSRPSAIVNGKTVYVGDLVNGAKVLAISQNEVMLQFKGQRRIYALH